MRAVIQRVNNASVTVQDKVTGAIGHGLLVLVGIEDADTATDVHWLAGKIANLRIFDDAQGIPNLSVQEVQGEVLVVSQFTLHASTKKGNRPSYIRASKPPVAVPLYEMLVQQLEALLGKPVPTGQFGAHMQVSLVNNGPVTILMDTQNKE
ncbi:MAG TPA: D-aminoacyl-tRNA deacylase [Phnomibacter sp.]|nr:D-aminoacyl-tRNA deacylase [Phnomibacter sp.]